MQLTFLRDQPNQCYGCHAKQDIAKPSGDWLNGKKNADPSVTSKKGNRQSTAFAWSESRSYLRWETPVLGINSEGLVSPFVPGCQVYFTQVNGEKAVVSNRVFTTVDGTSGISPNPVHPHTATKEARTCADCHMSSKALGLGGGCYISKSNGVPLEFELERVVDEDGRQIQATTHEGSRHLNKAEQRVSKAGTCIDCHGADKNTWDKARGRAGAEGAPTDKRHRKAIGNILKRAADRMPGP